ACTDSPVHEAPGKTQWRSIHPHTSNPLVGAAPPFSNLCFERSGFVIVTSPVNHLVHRGRGENSLADHEAETRPSERCHPQLLLEPRARAVEERQLRGEG